MHGGCALPEYLRAALARVHDEVITKYYGCGLVLPEALDAAAVLDLGCGAGRDVYTLAQLVGPDGFVVGVDMTPEQLAVARRHEVWHAEQFGYPKSNVEFIDGNIEHLDETGLADDRFDVIVSNCVINLATDKQAVLDQAWRLLKPGGEVVFRRHLYGSSRARRTDDGPCAVRRMPVRCVVLERFFASCEDARDLRTRGS